MLQIVTVHRHRVWRVIIFVVASLIFTVTPLSSEAEESSEELLEAKLIQAGWTVERGDTDIPLLSLTVTTGPNDAKKNGDRESEIARLKLELGLDDSYLADDPKARDEAIHDKAIHNRITVITRGPSSKQQGHPADLNISRLIGIQVVIDFTGDGDLDDHFIKSIAIQSPLRHLVIPASKVSDSGVVHIAEFAGLESLDLALCDITDASIAELSKLKYLKILNIYRTKISESARARLVQALPNCELYDFDWHF